jgi:hypothetical protein
MDKISDVFCCNLSQLLLIYQVILIQLVKISPNYSADFDEKVRVMIETIKKFPKSCRIILEIQNESQKMR